MNGARKREKSLLEFRSTTHHTTISGFVASGWARCVFGGRPSPAAVVNRSTLVCRTPPANTAGSVDLRVLMSAMEETAGQDGPFGATDTTSDLVLTSNTTDPGSTTFHYLTPSAVRDGNDTETALGHAAANMELEPTSGPDVPRIISIEPSQGPWMGGTTVKVHGWGFQYGTGDLVCRFLNHDDLIEGMVTEVSGVFVSFREVLCPTPEHKPGVTNVSVSVNGEEFSKESIGFTFKPWVPHAEVDPPKPVVEFTHTHNHRT